MYRLEDGHFSRETIDHTDSNDAGRGGVEGRDHVATHRHNNVINRALGVDRAVEVEVKEIKLRNGARFLLCSDGIYRHLSDEEIARVLAKNKDPQRAADELKQLVHERGADDNLTAVVVQAGPPPTGPILSIDNGNDKQKPPRERAREAGKEFARPDRRIRVEFSNPDLQAESPLKGPDESSQDRSKREGVFSPSRVLMYLLMGLVLIAASFYAGLRALEWRNARASHPGVTTPRRRLRAGREAFDRGDYQAAEASSRSILREIENATALYWLGRTALNARLRGARQGV